MRRTPSPYVNSFQQPTRFPPSHVERESRFTGVQRGTRNVEQWSGEGELGRGGFGTDYLESEFASKSELQGLSRDQNMILANAPLEVKPMMEEWMWKLRRMEFEFRTQSQPSENDNAWSNWSDLNGLSLAQNRIIADAPFSMKPLTELIMRALRQSELHSQTQHNEISDSDMPAGPPSGIRSFSHRHQVASPDTPDGLQPFIEAQKQIRRQQEQAQWTSQLMRHTHDMSMAVIRNIGT